MNSAPLSLSQFSSFITSVSDRISRSSAATFTRWRGWRAALNRFTPNRFQEAPLPTSPKICSQSASTTTTGCLVG